MTRIVPSVIAIALFCVSSIAMALDTPIVCFTPAQNCTAQLVQTIAKAQQSIYRSPMKMRSMPVA